MKLSNKLSLLIITIVSLAISWQFFVKGNFSGHDDLHVMRLFEMNRCFSDGQIPCRWAPDLGAGLGQPTFNYYSAFPYYLGSFLTSLGLPLLVAVKVLFVSAIILGSISAFLLLAEFFGTSASLLGGLAYTLLPYRAVDIFVRGALAESWSLALLPMVLFLIHRSLIAKDKKLSVSLAFIFGAFITTHNITTLLSIPIIVTFVVIGFVLGHTKVKGLLLTFLSLLLGFGLGSFFILPVIFERNLINTSGLTTDYFNFRAHFVTLSQLFISQTWGYGPSIFGDKDKLSFSIGIVQSIFLLISPFAIFRLQKERKGRSLILLLVLGLSLFYLFLSHNRSLFIWESLPSLSFVQFPWRVLGMVGLCTSVLISGVIDAIPAKKQQLFVFVSVIALILFNFPHFKFEKISPEIGGTELLSCQSLNTQMMGGIRDYQPLSVKDTPTSPVIPAPIILSGKGESTNLTLRSNYFASTVKVYSDKLDISYPVSFFPGWQVFVDRSVISTPINQSDHFGRITISLPKGEHQVQAFFSNTTVRTIGNLTTVISFIILVAALIL